MMVPTTTRNMLLVLGSLLAIAGSAVWIYRYEFEAPRRDMALHQRIGAIMAEQTAKLLGGHGNVLLITIPAADHPEMVTQIDEFNRTLKKLGNYKVREQELDPKDQPKYGLGSGLSGRRFVRAVNNHPCDAVVSLVGAPKMSEEDIAGLKATPKFVAESRSAEALPKLFEKGVIHAAVVSRFTFPAPGPLKPSTPQEWFDKRYQIVTVETARLISKEE